MFNKVQDDIHEEKNCEQNNNARSFPRMTLTVDELADELHISRPTAYELVKQEGFPAFHIGQRILISRNGLQRWIDQQWDPDPAA